MKAEDCEGVITMMLGFGMGLAALAMIALWALPVIAILVLVAAFAKVRA